MQMLGMQLCLSRKMQQVRGTRRGTRSCQQQSAHLQPIHAKLTDPVNLLQEEFEKESPVPILAQLMQHVSFADAMNGDRGKNAASGLISMVYVHVLVQYLDTQHLISLFTFSLCTSLPHGVPHHSLRQLLHQDDWTIRQSAAVQVASCHTLTKLSFRGAQAVCRQAYMRLHAHSMHALGVAHGQPTFADSCCNHSSKVCPQLP